MEYNTEKSRTVKCPECKDSVESNKPAPICEIHNKAMITLIKSVVNNEVISLRSR